VGFLRLFRGPLWVSPTPVNLNPKSTRDLVRMRGHSGGRPKLGGAAVLSKHCAAAEP
jgi:hypothetical protein